MHELSIKVLTVILLPVEFLSLTAVYFVILLFFVILFDLDYYQQQEEEYSVDVAYSVYTSHEIKNNVHVFEVEQGTQFFLKLNGNPRAGEPDLYKNGREVLSSPNGTINVRSHSMGIQSVTPRHEGTYKMESNGKKITIKLVITGMKLLF